MSEPDDSRVKLDPPQWFGFRLHEGGRWLTVIVRATWRDANGSHWGDLFSEKSPDGIRGQIPVDRILCDLDEQSAREAIMAMRRGVPVSRELCDKLPSFEGAQWTDVAPPLE